MEGILISIIFLACIGTLLIVLMVINYIATASVPPTRYEDVNGDSVLDKITYRKERHVVPGALGIVTYEIKEKVLYGLGVNGKTIYLEEEQWNSINK